MATRDNSVSRKFRVLEVGLKSARLDTKNNTKTYATAYIRPETKLQTKVNSRGGSTPVWDEKFVFSISELSSVCRFEIYRVRRLLRDSLIGTAECNLKSLFERTEIDRENHDEEACKYDTDHDQNNSSDDEDPRYDNMYETDKNNVTDDVGIEIVDEDKEPEQMMASTWVEVYKGSKCKGILKVELGLKEYISCVGDSKWPNMAMEYDKFMGFQSGTVSAKKREKHHSFFCYGAGSGSP